MQPAFFALAVSIPVGLLALMGLYLVRARRARAHLLARLSPLRSLVRGGSAASDADSDSANALIEAMLSGARRRSPRSFVAAWCHDRVAGAYPLLVPASAVRHALLSGVCSGIAFYAFVRVLQFDHWSMLGCALLAGLVGCWWWLALRSARAAAAFVRVFPEAVDQVVRLAAAGIPPLESIVSIARDTPEPVSTVLHRLARGFAGGLDPDIVLNRESRRVRISDFTLFCAVLRFQRRAGGSLAGPFGALAKTLRQRRATSMRVRTATAQTRLTLLLLACLPFFALFAQQFFSPETVNALFETEDGLFILRLSVVFIVSGIIVCRLLAMRITP